jgi:hypothetical protein
MKNATGFETASHTIVLSDIHFTTTEPAFTLRIRFGAATSKETSLLTTIFVGF